jgi:hypothetical protein
MGCRNASARRVLENTLSDISLAIDNLNVADSRTSQFSLKMGVPTFTFPKRQQESLSKNAVKQRGHLQDVQT